MSDSVRIGMVGVGLMGHGIASNLLKAGHSLCFLDHPGNQPAEKLLAAGGEVRNSVREVTEQAEVIILCLTGSPQVEAVVLASDGVLETLKPGTIIIDCSTAMPSSTRRVAKRVVQAGGRFIDAAMTRTPKEAAEGRLNLIVGAPVALFDEVYSLLSCFAEHITHAGDVGTGHALKLLHNFVSLGFSAVLAEAAAASRHADIDDTVLLDVLEKGGGGGVVLERLKPYIAAADTSGFRFSVANASKDLSYYHAMTDELNVTRGIATAVRDLYTGIDQALVVPEIIRVLQERGSFL